MAQTRKEKPRIYLDEYKLKQDPHDYGMADDLWSFEKFKRSIQIIVIKNADNEMEFDVIGVSPALVNAFRRLILSEVPSMAIEKVFIYNNTSIIQDEVLAHRLGLIPLAADPRLFDYKSEDAEDGGGEGTEHDTLEFELKVKCTKRKDANKDSSNFDSIYKNHNVYSAQIKWLPKGKQDKLYKEADVGPINDDILLCKMRPGQELDLKLLAVKGIGSDHAKFQPVASSSYRLLPEIIMNREVTGRDARLLQKVFSPGVIEIDKDDKAYVKDARYDNCSRNVFRYPHLNDAVTLSRIRDHFIFNIESLGGLQPDVIFIEAIKCLKKKCKNILEEISANK